MSECILEHFHFSPFFAESFGSTISDAQCSQKISSDRMTEKSRKSQWCSEHQSELCVFYKVSTSSTDHGRPQNTDNPQFVPSKTRILSISQYSPSFHETEASSTRQPISIHNDTDRFTKSNADHSATTTPPL